MAWITSRRLVAAVAGKPVAFIVNKEWWLRSSDQSPRSVAKRNVLAGFTGGLECQDFPEPLTGLGGTIDPVRVLGHTPRIQTANTPLMHHKFVVRLRHGKPVAVWTGSMNMTANSETSLENGLEIQDPVVAEAYFEEFCRLAALSEPLDFEAGKAAPMWVAPPVKVSEAAPRKRPSAGRKRKPAAPATVKKSTAVKKTAAPVKKRVSSAPVKVSAPVKPASKGVARKAPVRKTVVRRSPAAGGRKAA